MFQKCPQAVSKPSGSHVSTDFPRGIGSLRSLRAGQTRLRGRSGVSLTELMCVLAILSILFALYVGTIVRAYVKIMAFIKTLQ